MNDSSEINESDEQVSVENTTRRSVIANTLRHVSKVPPYAEGEGWLLVSFMLLNAALGVGILGFPYAYNKAGGLYFSTVIQFVVVILTIFTLMILVYCSDVTNSKTYPEVILSMCGHVAQYCAAISTLFTCFVICITLFIIIGDQYHKIFLSVIGKDYCRPHWYLNRELLISITAIVFILPMCYLRTLDFLKYASLLGFITMLYIIMLTIYGYFTLKVKRGIIKTAPDNAIEVLATLPLFSFAYQTHEFIVPAYACMERKSLLTFTKAVGLSTFLLLVMYCIAGTFGYLTWGDNVPADIMIAYDDKDPVVLIGVAGLILKMITTYPLVLLCGRYTVDGIYTELFGLQSEQIVSGEFKRRIIIASFWFVTTLIIAILTPDISIVLQVLGLFASLNVYIFPGICLIFLGLRERANLKIRRSKAIIATACIIIIFGGIIFIIVLADIIIENVHTSSKYKLLIPKC